ncbi:hypothetical protein NQ317_004395 [Molorchus minor]|uniref:F-box domain-containing protein n=1 Tax=Molorchus minor TaxID=1323400 RepID=A0ABQ9IYF2_9CUCU|nr:hypothetical protein NQ317_004395 [Molorchus minor]
MDCEDVEMDKGSKIETLLKMNHVEQFVSKVLDYTSRYNNSNSYYYSPINLVGKYVKYPSYGDCPETYFLVLNTFLSSFKIKGHMVIGGKRAEAYQQNYRPQDSDPLEAEDYITLQFDSAVIPRDALHIRNLQSRCSCTDLGKDIGQDDTPLGTSMGTPPEMCSHESRKFHPQIKEINHLINTIRLEFNQSHLLYHYSLDAVLLAGYQPMSTLQYNMLVSGVVNHMVSVAAKQNDSENVCDTVSDSQDLFDNLPYEVIIHIFQYLDLKSLSQCAQVNKIWNVVSADPILYQNLSLKSYWYLVDCGTLEYFMKKCNTLKKLDLSWCGNDCVSVIEFKRLVADFLRRSCNTLTHLSLGNCKYVDMEIMEELSACKELVDLRLINITSYLLTINNLTKLVSLDLTCHNIMDSVLIRILKLNPNLKHITVDLCENLMALDQVAEVVEKHNKFLTTWSSWKVVTFTSEGIKNFGKCPYLTELDLGWCLMSTDPGDCLEIIADGCRQLKRLILSEWRGLNDHLLMSIIMNCKELTQLDLLGIKNITANLCEKALLMLPKLRLLDISFCESVRQDEVEIWRQQFPHITIQRSCQYLVNDYLN